MSPSNLVKTIPSIPTFSLKVWATFTASWPVIESTTNSISCGLTLFLTFCNSSINCSSICRRPAVSRIITSFNFDIATFIACFAICTTSFDCSFAYTGIFNCAPTTCNCLIAAGLYTSQATNNGFLPCFLNRFASFPAVVVLPEPWSPTSIIIVGGFEEKLTLLSVPPNNSTNSSFTIFITCCPGVNDFKTSCPKAFSWIFDMNSFTIL